MTPSRRGQKRKLTYDGEAEENAKKKVLNDENHNVKANTPTSPAEHRVLRNHVNKLHTPCQKKLEFGAAAVTSDDCSQYLTTPTKFSSPTVNLPNYVLDPKPRTPQARPSSDATKESEVDWLTKIRIDLANETPDKQAAALMLGSPKTPVSVPKSARRLRGSSVTRGERSSPRLARVSVFGNSVTQVSNHE